MKLLNQKQAANLSGCVTNQCIHRKKSFFAISNKAPDGERERIGTLPRPAATAVTLLVLVLSFSFVISTCDTGLPDVKPDQTAAFIVTLFLDSIRR